MTYFGFLAIFLGIPIAILSIWTIRDYNNKTWLPQSLLLWNPLAVLISLCVVAFLYTTPWDNYLVATNVWWYDIDLVSGIVFGYVPIEEYTFFIVQPIMTGLLLFTLARYIQSDALATDSVKIRQIGTGVIASIWFVSVVLLILTFVSDQWDAFTYLSLELSWVLIPVMIQMAFGADILWRHRKVIVLSILISTVYLSGADAIAIGSGTWTIDPQQSLEVFIGGVLPIEEFVFFLLTNTLVAMGLVLVLAQESLQRAMKIVVLRPLLRLNAQYVAETA